MPTPTFPFAFHNSRAAKLLLTTASLEARIPAAKDYSAAQQTELVLYYNGLIASLAEYEAAVQKLTHKQIDIAAIKTAQRNYLLLLKMILSFKEEKVAGLKNCLLKVHQIYLEASQKIKNYKSLSKTEKNILTPANSLGLPAEIVAHILMTGPSVVEREIEESLSKLRTEALADNTDHWEKMMGILKERTRGTSLFPVLEGLYTHYPASKEREKNSSKKLLLKILNFIYFPEAADRTDLINSSQQVSHNIQTSLKRRTQPLAHTCSLASGLFLASLCILLGATFIALTALAPSATMIVIPIGCAFAAIGLFVLSVTVIMWALDHGTRDGEQQAATAIEIKPDQLDAYIAQTSPQPTPGWQEKVTTLFSPLRACFNQKETTFKPTASPHPPKRRGCFSMG